MRIQVDSNNPTVIDIVPDEEDMPKIVAAIARVRTATGQHPTQIVLRQGTYYGIPMR